MTSVSDHFDAWAESYDEVLEEEGFPFAGYASVVAAVADLAVAADPERVLDIGIGTGNLAAAISARLPAATIWGIDFSTEMLDRARRKVPGVRLVQAELLDDLSSLNLPRFHAIASTYVVHEFPDDAKLDLITYLVDHLLVPGGRLVIGDIAFETMAGREDVRREVGPRWDETEHYLTADTFLASIEGRGLVAEYRQVNRFAGVATIRREPQGDSDRGRGTIPVPSAP